MLTTMKDIMNLKLEKGFGFTLSMLDRIRYEANPIIHFPVVHSHYFHDQTLWPNLPLIDKNAKELRKMSVSTPLCPAFPCV